ncbi:MAG TPA: hypothetical protein DHU56_01350 [Marinobacter sp.]|jgi:translation initiation factor 2B subunit (eIF-2B alpha/beta/delta family)|uniref:hypothetical protein n=1 Tax=Marinobacter sp. TaxID=50741 RepID=UPI000ED46744|nr:hypothetical protein [Marinobacter sp.]MBC7191387.1 hypothetical protein [Marinobacter sp.]HCW88702.1 hypothetical protein [Marinobacter sp.]
MSFEEKIKKIAGDREHGSSVLVDHICQELASLERDPAYEKRLKWAFRELRKIDESMVVVHHLLDSLEPCIGPDFPDELKAYESRWRNIHRDIARHLLEKQDFTGQTVLMHSHSGMLIGVAAEVAGQAEGLHVWQTRSEPGGEGESQYQELRSRDIKAWLIEDERLPDIVARLDAAWLGVDQFNDEFFVNKLGSRRIVGLMQSVQKPVFVLGDSRKKVHQLKFSEEIFEKTPFGQNVFLITESSE